MTSHQHSGRIIEVRTGRILECAECGELIPLAKAAADADRDAAAKYRALQDRTMRENRETSRRMVRGEF